VLNKVGAAAEEHGCGAAKMMEKASDRSTGCLFIAPSTFLNEDSGGNWDIGRFMRIVYPELHQAKNCGFRVP
jgi:hypothetical protein